MRFEFFGSALLHTAYVADWKVQLDAGKPHEVKDHSVEVRLLLLVSFLQDSFHP